MTDIDTTTTGGIGAAIVTFLGAVALALRKWAGQQSKIDQLESDMKDIREGQDEVVSKLNALVTVQENQTEIIKQLGSTMDKQTELLTIGNQRLHDIEVSDKAYRKGVDDSLLRIEKWVEPRKS